jgi:hypothetical protein
VEATAHGAIQAGPWRAHGDDRGEFLLVVGSLPIMQAQQRSLTVDLDIVVRARPVPPPGTPVDSPAQSRADPLWHMPLEPLAALDPADPVAAGEVLPAGCRCHRSVSLAPATSTEGCATIRCGTVAHWLNPPASGAAPNWSTLLPSRFRWPSLEFSAVHRTQPAPHFPHPLC